MDRPLVYDGELPQTIDFLNLSKFGMVDSAYQNRGVIGINTAVAGLAAAPTTPASLQITIGVGSIWELEPADSTPFGDLGIDNHSIVKQGLLDDPVTLTVTPPTTPGYSQVYLVQVNLEDIDTGLAVVPYLNAANPSQPFSGPNNSGTSQYSIRSCQAIINLKAGPAMPTGTELTPAADAGWTGLYTIDIPNGTTQVTAPFIKTLDSAPFFPTLPAVPPDVQYNVWTFATDTGAVNALVAKVLPPPAYLQAGMGVFIKVAATNTGPATFNLNGLGAVPVHRANGAALSAGDINAGQVCALFYDGSSWQVLNFFGFTATTTNNITNTLTIPYANDTGGVNAMIGVFSPAITALAAGNVVTLKVANTNTGATTMQCNALAPVPVIENGVPLWARAVTAGQIIVLFYDGTSFQKLNTRWPYYSFDVASPPASDLTVMVGDQVNITFTNATSVPFHIASVPGGVYEIELAITASNSSGSDCALLPNNTSYANAFDYWGILADDISTSSPPYTDPRPSATGMLGSGASNIGITSSVNPNAFGFQPFLRSGGVDQINNRGPFLLRLVANTTTGAKMIRAHGGIRGGPMMQFNYWNDTSTVWSSLGTFNVAQGGGHAPPAATISGAAIITRLA